MPQTRRCPGSAVLVHYPANMNTLVIFSALLAGCFAAPQQYQQKNPNVIQILKQSQDINADGSYQWSYETENGIAAQEQGQVKNANAQEAVMDAQGAYKYTAPDGTPISVQYVANENGFQPQGAHIPAVPEYIQKALAWNAAHPEEENEQGKRGRF